jgi:two-component system sensor histidine kinase DctS
MNILHLAADWQERWRLWRRERTQLRPWGSMRLALWATLIGLVVAVLVTLVWLAGRYEASQVQSELERDTADAISDLRTSLSRDVQSLQGIQAALPSPDVWHPQVQNLLGAHREWLRVEWRDTHMVLKAAIDSPLRAPVFDRTPRSETISEILQSCQRAKRSNGPAYSGSYYLPQYDGLGMEVMELCLPVTHEGALTGFTLVTYSLQELLTERLVATYGRRNEISFTEADGTRLAMVGSQRRGQRLFTAQQLLDLPGTTMVLRMDGRRGAPELFPNLLTALVTAMSIALITVVTMLVKDSRRRLKAERELAEALAFRKAMEDSLVTGLRARDLQGQITYVNPAFCEMVGFNPQELIHHAKVTSPCSCARTAHVFRC